MRFLNEVSKAKYQANLPMYITYGQTNKAANDIATVGGDVLKALPSYPANAELQLPVSLEWYAKWETKAAVMYEAMLTE
jgi:putative spermidine/putrescine transport system substrate-binding protein